MRPLSLTAVVTGACLALLACGSPSQSRATRVAALSASSGNGALTYVTTCSICHGSDGKGTSSGPDLVGPLRSRAAADLITVVIDGVPGTSMAAFDTLSDQQLADLYAYMKAVLAR